jgi:hypothetical protein
MSENSTVGIKSVISNYLAAIGNQKMLGPKCCVIQTSILIVTGNHEFKNFTGTLCLTFVPGFPCFDSIMHWGSFTMTDLGRSVGSFVLLLQSSLQKSNYRNTTTTLKKNHYPTNK